MKSTKRLLIVLLMLVGFVGVEGVRGQDSLAGTPRIISTLFPTEDVVIASFNVTDSPYNADLTGEHDVTSIIQQAIDDCYESGGGVVWLPAGTYRISASLHVRNHVTVRGDWRDPDSGSGSYGTLILADINSGDENAPGLFRIWGSAGVKGLTVYYPEQSIDNPVSYPYTFEILGRYLGEDGYMSASVQNVTLLNAYRGISAGKDATHELHFINNVRGTALLNALNLQDTADVGRVQNIRFNNSYWAEIDPSLDPHPPERAEIDTWTQSNGTGLIMAGLEWDQMNNLSFSDYRVGIDIIAGRRINTAAMFAGLEIRHSQIGIKANFLDSRAGLAIVDAIIEADIGSEATVIQAGENVGGSVLINDATLIGGESILHLTGNTFVALHNVTIENWTGSFGIVAEAGNLSVQDVNFIPELSDERRAIQLGTDVSSAVFLSNRYRGDSEYFLENNSTGDIQWADEVFDFSRLDLNIQDYQAVALPSRAVLYNVQDAPFNALADGLSDDTDALQSALDLAGEQGGGIVYLPAGLYALYGNLVVPSGVELRGADDVPHRAAIYGPASGTILLSYVPQSTNNPDTDAPFIKLNGSNSGVRGLTFHYPEQGITGNQDDIIAYPWTIQGEGDNVYAVNLAFSNVYRGIDFASYETSNHYIDQIVGTVLKEGLWVGKSASGWVQNTHFNINAWVRANGLPGRLDETFLFSLVGEFTRQHLNAFVIADGSHDEFFLNNFVYSAHNGFQIDGNSNALLVNNAADGSEDIFVVHNTGSQGIEIINGEGCCRGGTMVRVENGTVRLFNLMAIERVRPALEIMGGETILQGASFQLGTVKIEGGGLQMNGVLFNVNRPHVALIASDSQVSIIGNIGGKSVV